MKLSKPSSNEDRDDKVRVREVFIAELVRLLQVMPAGDPVRVSSNVRRREYSAKNVKMLMVKATLDKLLDNGEWVELCAHGMGYGCNAFRRGRTNSVRCDLCLRSDTGDSYDLRSGRVEAGCGFVQG